MREAVGMLRGPDGWFDVAYATPTLSHAACAITDRQAGIVVLASRAESSRAAR